MATQYASAAFFAETVHSSLAMGKTTAQLNAALVTASRLADSYLKTRYTVPLTAWDDDLSRAVCDVAAYDIAGSKAHGVDGGKTLIRVRYDDAIRWLKDVSSGEASLAVAEEADAEHGEAFGYGASSDDERGW